MAGSHVVKLRSGRHTDTSRALVSASRASSTSRVTAARKTTARKPTTTSSRPRTAVRGKGGAARIRSQGGQGKAVRTWKGLSKQRRSRIKRRVDKRGGSLAKAVRTIQRRR